MSRAVDCVVVGHNDTDFAEFARAQQVFAERSASYSEVRTNSILDNGERRTYMELLNRVLRRVTGRPWDLNTFKQPSLGVAYLVSYLRRRGLSAVPVNCFNASRAALADILKEGAAAVAITTTYYVDDEPIKEVVDFVRRVQPDATIVVGGPRILSLCQAHQPRLQDLVFRSIGADVYVDSSEGEATLTAVVRALSRNDRARLRETPNLIVRDTPESFVRTPRMPERNDLEANVIDWSTFEPEAFTPTAYMRTARSCPFTCEFCNYPAMAGPHTYASVEVIEREMRYLAEHGLEYLLIVDDTFNVPLPRFKNICRMMIRNRFRFRWVGFFRCSNSDDETFDLMRESGCLGVYLGIESGDPTILQNMRKFADTRRYLEGIRKLHERGIVTLASMIVGFPGESAASVQASIDFLNDAAPTFYNVQVYFHDPKAPIEAKRDAYAIRGSGYSWSHATADWRQAVCWKEEMIRGVAASIQLPLYGFSIWSLPYLVQHGLDVDRIAQFCRFANRISHAELAGSALDVDAEIDAFCARSGWGDPAMTATGAVR
jgi:p-methyltransferase